MTDNILNSNGYIEFVNQKAGLLALLDQGIIIKKFWDDIIKDGKRLDLTASVDELERYYSHYNIGEIGKFTIEKQPEPANTRAEAIPETIYHPASVKSMGDKFSRQDALNIWRDVLEDMKKIVEPSDFDAYLRPMTLKSMSSTLVILQVKTEYVQEWAENCEQLADVLSKHIGSPVTVEIKVVG